MQTEEIVTPYKSETATKKEQVADMFNNIASNYDFLNHFLSLGIDILWRKKAISILSKGNPKRVLDVATGTADFAIESISMNPDKVVGIDISREMVAKGKEKLIKRGIDDKVELLIADSEALPFEDNHFDAITVAFGVRNFEDPARGVSEMYRVLAPGGQMAIIEFSKPKKFPVKQLYFFYFKNILPWIGRTFSKDSRAYTYLPESVNAFPDGEDFLNLIRPIGFSELKCIPLSFGIASIYLGKK